MSGSRQRGLGKTSLDPRIRSLTTDAMKSSVVLVSPVLVMGLGFVVAGPAASHWGAWAWIPVILYYWGILISLTAWGGGGQAVRRWLGPSQKDRWIWIWRVLALAVPALFLPPGFLLGLASMTGWWVPVLWFGLGAINVGIEEGYWRGLLLDASSRWPTWLAILYSALCFGASRLLVFGWQEGESLQRITYFLGTVLAGLIWGLVYRRTRSLRLPILGHFLQQMLAPPYHVFIQLLALFGM